MSEQLNPFEIAQKQLDTAAEIMQLDGAWADALEEARRAASNSCLHASQSIRCSFMRWTSTGVSAAEM